nr:immunoglobulin light chain junction region [Mus musculus]NSL97871.1 immunoglobulin light chain junction region [Mus musculus]NSM01001.1 immunoglobulin light chain junction region [Mus musculus]
CKQSYNLYTF